MVQDKRLKKKILYIDKAIESIEVDYQNIIDKYEDSFLIKILKNMIKNRYLDEEISMLIKEGIPITQHATTGQEGSQTVATSLLQEDDYVQPNHRGWGWAVGKGLNLKKLMAELMYKKNGYCNGKGGPHLADRESNLMLRSGIQGSYASLAAGVGLGLNMQNKDNVCLCLFGDGSSNAGYIHEGINIAAVNNLPVIYLCENNKYALFTSYQETTSASDIATRALGYDIPGYIVDGMDALAVIEVMRKAIKRAREGKGPTLIETKTYRYKGHASHDSLYYGGYRSKEEVDKWKKEDPIDKYINKLKEFDLITEKELDKIKENVKNEINEAVEYAKEGIFPEEEDFVKQVYANEGGSN